MRLKAESFLLGLVCGRHLAEVLDYQLFETHPPCLSRVDFLNNPRKEVLPEEEVFDWVWGPPQETSQIEYDRLPKPHQTRTTNWKYAPNI